MGFGVWVKHKGRESNFASASCLATLSCSTSCCSLMTSSLFTDSPSVICSKKRAKVTPRFACETHRMHHTSNLAFQLPNAGIPTGQNGKNQNQNSPQKQNAALHARVRQRRAPARFLCALRFKRSNSFVHRHTRPFQRLLFVSYAFCKRVAARCSFSAVARQSIKFALQQACGYCVDVRDSTLQKKSMRVPVSCLRMRALVVCLPAARRALLPPPAPSLLQHHARCAPQQ